MADSVGGGDVENREKARRRGRAYQCMHCYHKEGQKVIDVKYRMEDHILRLHMTLEQAPFYCKLCFFRCFKWEQLVDHITSYRRHIAMAHKGNVVNHSDFLVRNTQAYKISQLDYCALSAEDSINHFLSVSRAAEAAKKELPLAVRQCLPDLDLYSVGATDQLNAEYVPTPVANISTLVESKDPFFLDQPIHAIPCKSTDDDLQEPVAPIEQNYFPQDFLDNQEEVNVTEEKNSNMEGLNLYCGSGNYSVSTEGNLVSKESDPCVRSYNASTKDKVVMKEIDPCVGSFNISTKQNDVLEESDPSVGNDIVSDSRRVHMFGNQEGEENIMDQLLPVEDVLVTPVRKRSLDESEKPLPLPKKLKDVDVRDMSERTLVEVVGKLTEVIEKNNRALRRMEDLMVDNTCVMAKVVEAMTRLKRTIEESERQERREERRHEYEERRDAERRWEDERRRREEDRRKESRRQEEKENKQRVRSTLGRSFTENRGDGTGRRNQIR